jgi:predicted amidohydrolase YtcJ
MSPSPPPAVPRRGVHDHHVHLLSLLASRASLDVSVEACPTIERVLETLAGAPGDGWLRAWGFDEGLVAEGRELTLGDLDAAVPDRPLVIHHRSGHAEIRNSIALATPNAGPPPLERAELFSLAACVSRQLQAAGVTALTDCTPTNGPVELALLAELPLRQRIIAMVGVEHLGEIRTAPTWAKVMAAPESIPPLVALAHERGWPVAVHVDDIDVLDATLGALEVSPPPRGRRDRIEHLSLALPEQVERLARLPVMVVTQPAFLLHRAAKYRRSLSEVEQGWLYRVRSLLEAHIPVRFSSDAPVTPIRPRVWIEAAASRNGFAPSEAVTEEVARAIAST